MSALNGLKLTAAKRTATVSPVMQRRSKVVKRITEQIELAKAKQDGKLYASTKLKKITDAETGERRTVQVEKAAKGWDWVGENGKTFVCLRYGAKAVELAKGKTAVELTSAKELVATLEKLMQAVMNGELDAQLEAVSGAVKADFKK